VTHHRALHIFAAVAQAGSLAAAARQLQMSPATVMRTVAALEARLRCTLLLRGPRGVRVTIDGEQFAQSCQRILTQTEAAERSAAGLHASPQGRLTIALPSLIESQVFTHVALAYLNAHPDVRLAIEPSDGAPRLLKDGIDVAIVVGPLPDSSEFAIALGAVRPIICASPGYLAKWGRPVSVDHLNEHRMVVATSPGYDLHWRLPGNGSPRTVKAQRALTCTTQRGAIGAAILGVGLICCMSYEVHEHLSNGLLEPVLADAAGESLPVNMIYRHGRRAEARVRSFIDFAAPLLRAHPAFTHQLGACV